MQAHSWYPANIRHSRGVAWAFCKSPWPPNRPAALRPLLEPVKHPARGKGSSPARSSPDGRTHHRPTGRLTFLLFLQLLARVARQRGFKDFRVRRLPKTVIGVLFWVSGERRQPPACEERGEGGKPVRLSEPSASVPAPPAPPARCKEGKTEARGRGGGARSQRSIPRVCGSGGPFSFRPLLSQGSRGGQARPSQVHAKSAPSDEKLPAP